MANTYTKNYQDGSALTEAQLDTAYTSLQIGLDKTANLTTGATTNTVLTASTPGSAATWSAIPDPESLAKNTNYALAASAAGGAITISLKSSAGTDPTSSDQVKVSFSTPGTTTGDITEMTTSSARSISIPASATLGISGTATNNIYIYALRNSSANMALGVSKTGYFDQNRIVPTTISTSADSSTVLYSAVASTATNSVRLLGFIEAAKNSSEQWQTPTGTRVWDTISPNEATYANQVINSYTRTSGSSAQAVRGVAISPSSSGFDTTSSTYVDVTNLSVTLTTSGRPIKIELISGSTSASSGGAVSVTNANNQNAAGGYFQFLVDSVTVATFSLNVTTEDGGVSLRNEIPCGGLSFIYPAAAGTYTIKMQAKRAGGSSSTVSVSACKLVAYEL